MKKPYSKPLVFIEDFSLQTSIAAGCELITPMPTSDDKCGFPMQGAVVFVEGAQCTYKPQEGAYNGFCYHVPAENTNLFNS